MDKVLQNVGFDV